MLDFGIARIAHGAQCTLSAAQPALEGLVAGSPHYLAPEQLQGGTIDGRTDVYSLGVVLYELLAGRKAFEGDSLQQITNAVLHVNPAPADALQPAVPAGLAAVASKAMARDPAERFASAAEFALALRPWQERASAEEARPGADPGQRRRLLVLLPMLGAAMALGAASTWWWHAPADAPASTAIAVAATPPAAAALVPPVEATPAEDALANDAAASAPDAVPSATTVAEAPPLRRPPSHARGQRAPSRPHRPLRPRPPRPRWAPSVWPSAPGARSRSTASLPA